MTGNLGAVNLGSLVRCYEGMRNRRALAMMAAGLVLAALLLMAEGMATGMLMYRVHWLAVALGVVLTVLAGLAVLVGTNMAALLLVDQVDGRPPREFGQLLVGGLINTLLMIAGGLVLGVGVLLVVAVLWLVSLLAHVPGVGGFFTFFLAGPSMLVLMFCFGVALLGGIILSAGIWRGHGLLGALSRTVDVVLRRPLELLLHVFALLLIMLPVNLFVYVMAGLAGKLVTAMYAGWHPAFGGMGLGGGLVGSLLGPSSTAMTASILIVLLVISTLLLLAQLYGNVLIFDSLSASVDDSASRSVRAHLQDLRSKVDEQRQRYQASSQQRAAAPALDARRACRQCGTELSANDRFCGHCGAAWE